MSVILEKTGAFTGKVTSVTMTDAGPVVNVELEGDSYGTILVTTTFGPAVDNAGEVGPVTERAQAFLPDGSTVNYTNAGTWKKVGDHRWDVRMINLASNGERALTVEEWDLATRSTKGTIYALD